MASISDIGLSAAINFLSALAFLVAFAVLRLQPINDRVYFSKWYLKGIRSSPTRSGTFVQKFVNLNLRSYLKFLEWMPAALKMPEPELIDHAGLDSAVFLRIYLIGYATYFQNCVHIFVHHLACCFSFMSHRLLREFYFFELLVTYDKIMQHLTR